MKEFFIAFLGYLLLTIGLYALYFTFFRHDRNKKNPLLFKKLWFKILVIVVSLVCIIAGWLIIS